MNDYNYSNNGVEYDPDLIYENPAPRRRRDLNRDERDYTDNPQRGGNDRYGLPPQRRRQAREEYDNTLNPPRRPAAKDYNSITDRYAPRKERTPKPEENRSESPRQRPISRRRPEIRQEPQATAETPKRIRQPKPKKPATPFREWGIVKFICDKRFHAVVGVALVFLAVYISVAAISFIRSGAEDQSIVSSMSVGQIVAEKAHIENAGGPVGAKLTQSVVVQGLGLGSLALIAYLAILGFSLMGIRKRGFWSITFKTLLVAITASMVLGFISLWSGAEFMLGGFHGHYINMFLVNHIDWIGASLVNLLLIVAVFYVYINDLLSLYNRWQSIRRARKAKAEQARIEREEDRERVRRAMEEPSINDYATENYSDESSENHQSSRIEPLSVGFDDYKNEQNDIYAIPHYNSDLPEEPESLEPEDITTYNDNRDYIPQEIEQDSYATDTQEPETSISTSPNYTSYEPGHAEESLQNVHSPEPDNNAMFSQTVPVTDTTMSSAGSETANQLEMPAAELVMPGLEVVANTIEKGKKDTPQVYDPTAELSRYSRPGLDLLRDVPVKANSVDLEEQEENKERITKTLNDYGIAISHIQATVGPTVTLYEIIPAEGVRIAKIKRLEDDIAMSLAALGIRIIAPIPGKGTIGIEVPNKDPQTVSIRSILGSRKFQECKYQLPMAMGATISNEVYIADLCKMPHLLVAGATGMGKSVGLNTIIASLLYKKHPAELKFVLIDPKMVEFSLYSVLERHFLAKLPDEEEAVVTSMDKVLATLNSLCVEMDQRYMLLRDANVRSITEYNERFIEKRLNPEKGHRYLPYIVMIVDEFADLIMTAGKEVEKPIARIAQKARAVGMHMIIATQRPSTNVITGIIKANFPGRIAFRVSQMVDSKTILDRTGANQLIGRGDMLFSHNGTLDRVQCAFIDTPEVQAICDHIDKQIGYEHAYYLPEPQLDPENTSSGSGSLTDRDPLFEEIAEAVVTSGVASTSSLQRRYSIGFNRAGKIMDQLEAAGIVGPAQGGKPRTILVDRIQLGSILHTLE